MQVLTSFVNQLWGILSIVAQLLSIALIVAFLVPKFRNGAFVRFFKERGVLIAFIISLLATVGSLIYSDVIGYEPCKLCWFQRIFMYPQVLLMGMALWRKDMSVKIYGVVLSVIGLVVAKFHYLGQIGLTPLPCSAVGYSVSCAERFVFIFGYITIPMMAFSAFLLMSVVLIISSWRTQSSI